jgi:hemolysin activation/secretion protein
MTRIPHIALILFILFVLSFSVFTTSAFAQISNIERQDQIIRQQQEVLMREKRNREFEKINKERKQLKEEENKQDQKTEKSAESIKSDQCFTIKTIEIIGAKSLSNRQKRKIKSPFLNKCFDGTTLSKLVQKTKALYQKLGFITAQITVPQQNIASGNLKIAVIEGKIEKITLNDDKFTDKMQQFTAFGFIKGDILDIDDINQGIRQINRLSTNNAKMKIEPANKVGYSKVIVSNQRKFPISTKISYDNLGSEFTGIRKANLSGTIDNLLFLNDQINLSYSDNLDDPSKEKDSRSFTGGISMPFTYNTLSYDYSRTKYKGQNEGIDGPIILSGYSNKTNVAIDRTLLNNTEYRISTNLSLAAKQTASYLNDSKLANNERKLTISTLSFALSKYFKNGASLYLKPQYLRGLKLLNAKQDDSGLTTDIPKAQFQLYKLYASFSKRFQIPKINAPITLSIEMDSQISKDTLFGSEQFSVGGYYSVRGFREANISGDHGYYFRNKASFNLGQFLAPVLTSKKDNKSKDSFISKHAHHFYKFSMEPFYDYGYVKTKHNGDSGRLSGAGIKTIFSSKYFDASLTYSAAISKSSLIASQDKENKMLYFELSTKCC